MKGYKLFEMKEGQLFPLFINKKEYLEAGTWVPAEAVPTKGYALRPGWHIGEIPDAPWLKGYDGSETGCYKSRFRKGKRVWCEVEFHDDIDYNPMAEATEKGWLENVIPENGYYSFKETGNRLWIIAGEMKVNRILNEEERQEILNSMGYDEEAAYAKYKRGFEKKAETMRLKAMN